MLQATRIMLRYFDQKGMKYADDIDTTKNGKDVVRVTYRADNVDKIVFKIFVDPDADNVAIRVWSIAKANNNNQYAALTMALNKVNNDYRWYRFYLDDDNEVTAAADAVVDLNTIGAVTHELIARGVNIIDEVYPSLMKALWS